MPKIHLTPNFVANPTKPNGKAKIDYFDIEIPGFLLEVRVTGKCTYYQRYRDTSGRLKQFRIGPVDSLSLEDARNKAKRIRSQASMGLDPRQNLDGRVWGQANNCIFLAPAHQHNTPNKGAWGQANNCILFDLEIAFDWYENQFPGLGLEFLDCIEEKIQKIKDMPKAYPVHHENFRRALL